MLDLDVALFDVYVGRAVLAHRAELDEMALRRELVDREEHVEGAYHVVVLRVDRVPPVDHRVGRRTLLGVVHDGIRLVALHDIGDELPVQEVAVLKGHRLPAHLLPHPDPLLGVGDRREALRPELVVYRPADEIVHDDDLVARLGEMQRGRPAAVAVTPEYQNLHRSRLLILYVGFLFRIKPNLNWPHWPP